MQRPARVSSIRTRGLTKDFGQERGVFDLDLDVPKGRVHGFLGPNGAGKTTTIRLLMDLLRPTRGTVRLLGTDPESARLHGRVGYVPGDLELPGATTGRRYLADSAALHGGVDASWRDELVALLGAEMDHKVRQLSKGNKQKLALIDALQHRPELLILDEPTDGLDPLLRDRVRTVLRAHARQGGTVFLSSHVVHEIQTMCDDVSIVLGGRLRMQSSIRGLLADEPTRIVLRIPDATNAIPRLRVPGVQRIERRGDQVRLRVLGDLLPVLAALPAVGATEVHVQSADLEELFLRLYAEAP